MRRGFGLLGLVVAVILLAIVGTIAYNIGWSDGLNTHMPAGTTAPAGPYHYYGFGFHPFFAGFGILWFLLILFGIFWLFRLAFWGFAGRRMSGYGGGWGYGHGSFEERAQDWHRRQHEGSPSSTPPPQPPPAPPSPPSDTRSV